MYRMMYFLDYARSIPDYLFNDVSRYTSCEMNKKNGDVNCKYSANVYIRLLVVTYMYVHMTSQGIPIYITVTNTGACM